MLGYQLFEDGSMRHADQLSPTVEDITYEASRTPHGTCSPKYAYPGTTRIDTSNYQHLACRGEELASITMQIRL